MARIGPRALACALVVAALCGLPAVGGDDANKRFNNHLAVQVAFEQGLGHLKRQEHEAAVRALEKQIRHIDGNARYLQALGDAYRGYIRDLQRAGKGTQADVYRARLAILEPKEVNTAAAMSPPLKADLPAQPVAVAAPARKAEAVSRGQAGEDDGSPFAAANSAEAKGARGLLESAEKAFTAKQYGRAGALYAQAEGGGPALAADCRERWAYCKLYVVAAALNQGGRGDGGDLEGEVKQALRMSRSGRLESFGQGLLQKLRDGAPGVEVKHTPRKGTGWAVAETANFRLLHTTTAEAAEKLVKIAEAARVSMARKWFDEEPAAWSPRCEVYVHATAEAYAKATGKPTDEPGFSEFQFARGTGRVLARRVHVRLDDPDVYNGTLRHETTHVVLAGRFGADDIPRWADEGIAVLSEPAARVKQHTGQLAALRRDGQLFRLAELMRQEDAVPRRRMAAFYAQSVLVVEFLVKKKDEVTFTRFVKAARGKDYDAALERYYGYKGVAELERDWLASLGGAVVAAKKKR